MIAASLIVIASIGALLFRYQHDVREDRIRTQGIELIRNLSDFGLTQLVPDPHQRGMLHAMPLSQNNPDFAYAAVVDVNGEVLAGVTAAGVVIPIVSISPDPSSWFGERQLPLDVTTGTPADQKEIRFIEFHAQIFDDGNHSGFIRLGYHKPKFGLGFGQVQFVATLALPIFLLTPLFFFMLRREMRPLQQINHGMNDLLNEGSFRKIEISASGELGAFMNRFNEFMEHAQGRLNELETDHAQSETTARLLVYKKNRIECVLEAMPETVIVLDESGIVSFANSKLWAVLGVSAEEIIGLKPADWCQYPELLEFFERCHGKGLARYLSEAVEFSPHGDPDTRVAANAYPLFSPQNSSQALGTLIVFRDVTVEGLAKRSRGEFIAHVAHELKSPLNVLAMYVESLQGEDGDKEDFRIEAFNVMQDEVERVSSLINNLLNITKIEMGSLSINRQHVKLRDMLKDAFEAVSRNARDKKLNFELDLPHEISPILADKDLLRIAVNNLLTNAIKYNHTDGTVTLAVEETEDQIFIHVSDTGIGIAPQEQQQIYEKFFRSEDENVRVVTGHGLGLSLARDIVSLHNGELSVTSNLGEGSKFTIELLKDSDAVKQAI